MSGKPSASTPGERRSGGDPAKVSRRARDRGRSQLGTIGAGNHFVELQTVEEIFDRAAATAYGLVEGGITVLIHTGSRGLGHQVCTDFVRLLDERMPSYGITLPDRQLSCAPASSQEGRDYLAAMAGAANFAWANRQLIAHRVRQDMVRLFPEIRAEEVRVVYDVAHSIAKVEEHGGQRLCVHRKGATRSFGPGHPELASAHATTGQPVFIPGSMGTATFVMAGVSMAEARSFGSACHKDVERVAEVVETAGLARRVARLRPIGVIKG
ncbi:MAG TPA: RtcB family protein [Gemmatimonadaceae bacterium]|nr:RtcB family protein [Gemmatimonadaceae bacterium]